MVAEQNTPRLQELKSRMEMLISYYRSMGEEQMGYVQELELRLRSVTDAMNPGTDPLPC